MLKDPYTAAEALATWQTIQATPPRALPSLNGHGPAQNGSSGTSYAWNERGNAQRLLDEGGLAGLRYVEGARFPWHYWDGTCWPEDRVRFTRGTMERVLQAGYEAVWKNRQARVAQTEEAKWLLGSLSDGRLDGALSFVANHVAVLPDVFDTHDWLVPGNNGWTYDLRSGGVIPSLPEHYMTRCVPWPALREPGEHPKFDEMLERLTCGNKELADYLLLLSGLCLTGYTGMKNLWFWQGRTNAGKTTFLTLLARLGGPFVYAIPLKALLKHRQDTGILHEIAGIRGMRLVYAEEFKPGDILDSAWVKKISGEGDITADRKHENSITFRGTAKLIIGTNDLPLLTDVDDALRARVRVVPFRADIPAAMEQTGMPLRSVEDAVDEVLNKEGPAILYTLAQRVAAWYPKRPELTMPKAVSSASKDYLTSQDTVAEWIETCCEPGWDKEHPERIPTEEEKLQLWYWSYIVQSESDPRRVTPNWFGRRLDDHGFKKRSSGAGKWYTGPKLLPEARVEAEAKMWGESWPPR